jgi:hypothetical protein
MMLSQPGATFRMCLLCSAAFVTALALSSGCVARRAFRTTDGTPLGVTLRDPKDNSYQRKVYLFWSSGDSLRRGECVDNVKFGKSIASPETCNDKIQSVVLSAFNEKIMELTRLKLNPQAIDAELQDLIAIRAELERDLQSMKARMISTPKGFEADAIARNRRLSTAMLQKFNETNQEKIAELQSLRDTQVEAARLLQSASTVMADGRTYLIHELLAETDPPQKVWHLFNDLVWQAFESCKAAAAAEQIGPELKQSLLSELLSTRSIYFKSDGLSFLPAKNPEPPSFAMFSSDQLYLNGVTLDQQARNQQTVKKNQKNDSSQIVVLPVEFRPQKDQPLCKMWMTQEDADSSPNLARVIKGQYASVQLPNVNPGLIHFSRVLPREADGIAKDFILSCGFAQPSDEVVSATKGEAQVLKIGLSLGQGLSSLDEFTLGHFLEIFERRVESLEIRE